MTKTRSTLSAESASCFASPSITGLPTSSTTPPSAERHAACQEASCAASGGNDAMAAPGGRLQRRAGQCWAMTARGKTLLALLVVAAVAAAALAAPRSDVVNAGPSRARSRGSCPPVPKAGTQRFCGTEGCSDDNGCPSNLICCNNGCVHVCRNPVFG